MSSATTHILVTGANSGLGLGICLRLIDDFLKTESATSSLNVIFTTRSARKSKDTQRALESHLRRNHSPALHARVTFQAESVDLTNLLSVVALARTLNASSLSHLNAIICNAGIGGWGGLNWPQAIWTVTTDIRNATTWPIFKLGIVGAVTKPQLTPDSAAEPEPPLGEVFCANVFGHYMLVHWLMHLLRACESTSPGKIIWVSSTEPQRHHFNENDFQGLRTDSAYEHGKRMTDLISLTANHPSTQKEVSAYTAIPKQSEAPPKSSQQPKRPDNGPPKFHLYHPGIAVTSVMSLYWIIHQAYLLGIYLARWAGSPWATVEPYAAAHAATWLALTPERHIRDAEVAAFTSSTATETSVVEGRIKWGTATDRLGRTTPRPTEVPDWGVNGSGLPYAKDWWGGVRGLGRKPGSAEATREDVEEFVKLGRRVWKGMERLRGEWERRLEDVARNGAIEKQLRP